MATNITISTSTEGPRPIQATLELDAKQTLDGSIIIFDHIDVDIVVSPSDKKIVTFAKNSMTDEVYETQDRLFKYLRDRGIVTDDSVQGGNVYGSMEAAISESVNQEVDSLQATVYTIGKFIEEERPYFEQKEFFLDTEIDVLTEPDEESSTELGEVPHQKEKGSLVPGYVRGPYGMTSFYRY